VVEDEGSEPASVADMVGVDDAGAVVATIPLSQGFGGETIVDLVFVVVAGR